MSDLLIKNMEMPKSCKDCTRMGISHCPMKEESIIVNGYDKPLNCPLVELPPHGRLGDLDKLLIKVNCIDVFGNPDNIIDRIIQAIGEAPTVLEASE